MTSVVPLRSVRNEASEWLARLQSEYASDEDRRQFEVWIAGDPQRREVYAKLAGTWRRLESIQACVSAAPTEVSDNPRNRPWAWIAAAALAVVAVVSVFIALDWRADAFQTAVGEQRRVALSDNSTVELNTDSRVAVDFKDRERVVRLERGEARFKVAQEPGRPFIVKAAGHLVRAVGTEFNVRIEGAAVEVLVVEGAVSFAPASGGDALMLRAGQTSASSKPGETIAVTHEELERRLAWHDGMVSFRGETLRQVLAELSRYNPVRFQVADEAAANIRVSGYFRATDIPSFLSRLEANFPVDVRRAADGSITVAHASADSELR